MPPLLVRLNLPGFSSPEPFRLASAPPSMTGLACAVLEEIGGFSREELQGVRNNPDRVPLTLLGELCAGQLVELASDAELEVFLATAESPRGPAVIEVRPRDAVGPQEAPSPALQPQTPLQAAPDTSSISEQPAVAPAAQLSARQQPEPVAQPQPAAPQLLSQQPAATLPEPQALFSEEAAPLEGAGQAAPPAAEASALEQPSVSDANGSFEQPPPGSGAGEPRTRTPDIHRRGKARSNPSSRGPTPSERRQAQREEAESTARRRPEARSQAAEGKGKGRREAAAPVHIRLYQDKDDRRRKMEEARLRRIEQEEEDIRSSAERALGRAASPARCQSPGREAASPVPSRNATPPRTRPPLPERPSSAGVGTSSHPSRRRTSTGTIGSGPRTGAPDVSHRAGPHPPPVAVCPPEATKLEAATASSPSLAIADASSACSESLAPGVQSIASAAGEDSACEDMQGMRQLMQQQQQRIDFLEKLHQQALKQLRTAREELNLEQQKRFREANKVLALEQLVSEMQAQRFEAEPQMQLRWEEWLQRSRSILEAD